MTKKKKNKPRAEQEPRSAHGRAVKKNKPRAEQEPRSAHGRAVKNPVQSKNRARPMAARLKNPVQSKNRARPMAARLTSHLYWLGKAALP